MCTAYVSVYRYDETDTEYQQDVQTVGDIMVRLGGTVEEQEHKSKPHRGMDRLKQVVMMVSFPQSDDIEDRVAAELRNVPISSRWNWKGDFSGYLSGHHTLEGQAQP